MTTNNIQPQPMEQPKVETQEDEDVSMEQPNEMEQGGQVERVDPDKIVLDWGMVFTFFK